MPAFLEKAFAKSAKNKGFTGERAKHYIFGGMNAIGAMHGNKTTAKGEAMEAKHETKLKDLATARKS